MPARHGIGQLAQLDGKFVQILAQRHVVHPATLDHRYGVVTSMCLLVAYSSFPAWRPTLEVLFRQDGLPHGHTAAAAFVVLRAA
jgi:hypothetical protein